LLIADCNQPTPIQMLGLNLALAFIFLRTTNLHELVAEKLGTNLFILYWFVIPSFACLVFSGGLSRLWAERTVRIWIAFALWLLLAVPGSDWPGGSLQVALGFIRTELPVLFLIAGFVITWSDCCRLLSVLIASAFVNILIGFLFPAEAGTTGRLDISVDISMNNANDFAALLLLLLPFLILFLLTPARSIGSKCLTLPCLGYGLYLILSTGSRGALIGLFVALIFALTKLSLRQRVLITGCITVTGCVMLLVVPSSTVGRLASTLSAWGVLSVSPRTDSLSASDESMQDESAEARWYLLKRSLLFTAQHPILGVGPGQFANHEGFSSRAEGLHGNWHETHNSYTQASSEAGIPAFIFLIAALISTYRSLRTTYYRARTFSPTDDAKKMQLAAFSSLISFTAFCTTISFLSLVYSFYLPLLTGLAIALNRASEGDGQCSSIDIPDKRLMCRVT
jgi:O-antigen ligase